MLEANERAVCAYLKEKYGIKNYLQVSDGCAAQYVNRRHMCNVARACDVDGINMTHVVLEPYCGKGVHDSLGGTAKKILRSHMEKEKKWVPNCFEGFRICRKIQPSKAEKFAEYEAKEDGDALKKHKKE